MARERRRGSATASSSQIGASDQGGRLVAGDRRKLALMALDLDQAGMGDRRLSEPGRAAILCQHVRIAVLVERADEAWFEWVVPGARRHLHDALHHRIADDDAGETGPAVVEDTHDVAVRQTTQACIL